MHIVELGLTLSAQDFVPLHYWSNAYFTFVFLVKRLPSSTLSKISPHEKLFGSSPYYSFLCVFSCLCFLHLRPFHKTKWVFRSEPCVFLV